MAGRKALRADVTITRDGHPVDYWRPVPGGSNRITQTGSSITSSVQCVTGLVGLLSENGPSSVMVGSSVATCTTANEMRIAQDREKIIALKGADYITTISSVASILTITQYE